MNDKQTNKEDVVIPKRRSFLKKTVTVSAVVAGGVALPTSWKKPIIDSVEIPFHAHAASGESCSGGSNPLSPGC